MLKSHIYLQKKNNKNVATTSNDDNIKNLNIQILNQISSIEYSKLAEVDGLYLCKDFIFNALINPFNG